jgi:OFA family oxalate/formate antiporter-like MFS transporter
MSIGGDVLAYRNEEYLDALRFCFTFRLFIWGPRASYPRNRCRIFGTRNLGAIMGFILLGSTFSGALGPFLGAYIFDLTGSYYFAFLLGAVATVLATIFAIPAKKPEKRHSVL